MHTPASLELIRVEDRITDALSLDGPVDPRSVQFILKLYAVTGRDELTERAGLALAAALRDCDVASSVLDRSAWLELFVEARALADDPRIAEAVAKLIASLRADWTAGSVADAAAALDACLRAATLDDHRSLAAAAIDQLERIVRTAYQPGRGVGRCADQIRMAGALLAAYQLSGRLPYPMLAEELVSAARPFMSDEFDFTTCCQAARVLCRLAMLHGDDGYRRAAIVAPASDYRREAKSILERQSAAADHLGAAGAIYGVALLELESTHPAYP